MRGITSRLTYANVMATVAAFLALGGGALAVTAARNSVKTKSIKNGAVTKAKLAADVTDAFLPRDAASTFLPATAASDFLPTSSVRRIAFLPTGCDDLARNPGCNADIVSFGGLTLHGTCIGQGPELVIELNGSGNFSANVSRFMHDQAPFVDANVGPDQVLGLAGNFQNAMGSIVIQTPSGEQISIVYHAYVGPGTNCVFEGTATRA